jgi:hypothetical protein
VLFLDLNNENLFFYIFGIILIFSKPMFGSKFISGISEAVKTLCTAITKMVVDPYEAFETTLELTHFAFDDIYSETKTEAESTYQKLFAYNIVPEYVFLCDLATKAQRFFINCGSLYDEIKNACFDTVLLVFNESHPTFEAPPKFGLGPTRRIKILPMFDFKSETKRKKGTISILPAVAIITNKMQSISTKCCKILSASEIEEQLRKSTDEIEHISKELFLDEVECAFEELGTNIGEKVSLEKSSESATAAANFLLAHLLKEKEKTSVTPIYRTFEWGISNSYFIMASKLICDDPRSKRFNLVPYCKKFEAICVEAAVKAATATEAVPTAAFFFPRVTIITAVDTS